MSAYLFEIIWITLHWLASVFYTLQWLKLKLQTAMFWSYDRVQQEQNILKLCSQRLTKTPRHLSLIVGPNNKLINESVLRSVFNYALLMKIDCLSIYDVRAALSSPRALKLENVKVPKNISFNKIQDNCWIWSSNKTNGIKKTENKHIDLNLNGNGIEHRSLKVLKQYKFSYNLINA